MQDVVEGLWDVGERGVEVTVDPHLRRVAVLYLTHVPATQRTNCHGSQQERLSVRTLAMPPSRKRSGHPTVRTPLSATLEA